MVPHRGRNLQSHPLASDSVGGVDEEGADDLREDARLHEHLVERGLTLGYYGIFTDRIGSTALVIDSDEEFDVETPISASSSSP